MAQTFSKMLVHVIFSTKERLPLIGSDWNDQLFAYMGGIIKSEFGYPIRINGVADHVHLLIDMKTSASAADMVRVVKSRSSHWLHETFADSAGFSWQGGYGIFSIGESQQQAAIAYINKQQEHHRRVSFQEEFLAFLQRYQVEYDPRYVWQ